MTPLHRRPTPMGARFTVGGATLEVLSSAVAGLTGWVVRVDAPRVVVGRDAQAGLSVADPRLSRRHAELRREGDEVVLIDLSSTNGSWVNGARCVRRRLEHGDSVRLGSTVFLFTSPAGREGPRPVATALALDAAAACVDENFKQVEAAFFEGRLTVDALAEQLRECRHALARVLDEARRAAAAVPPGDATPVVGRNPAAGRS